MEDPRKVVDKGYAWLVLFVAVIYNMIEAMLFFSSTIYMVEWDNTFDVTNAQLGMAGALMNGFTCFTGIFVGPLIARVGCRPASFIGAFITAAGFLLSVPATSIQWLYVTYGVIAGIGGAFISMPGNICVQYYFRKRRPLAIGIAGVGTSLGILIGLPAIQYLINFYGWRGAFMINAGVVLQFFVLASFFRPMDTKLLESIEKEEKLLESKEKEEKLLESTEKEEEKPPESTERKQKQSVNSTKHKNGITSVSDNEKKHCEVPTTDKASIGKRNGHSVSNEYNGKESEIIEGANSHNNKKKSIKSTLINCITNIWDFHILLNIGFLIYVFNVTLGEYAIITMYKFTPLRAVGEGVSTRNAAFLPSCTAIFSASFRFIGSIVANQKCINRFIMCGLAMLGQGIVICSSSLASDFFSYAIFAGLFGIFLGLEVCVTPIILTDIVGISNLAQANAFLYLSLGVVLFTSQPLAGLMIDISGSYNTPFYVFGAFVCLPAVLFLCMPLILKSIERKSSPQEMPKPGKERSRLDTLTDAQSIVVSTCSLSRA